MAALAPQLAAAAALQRKSQPPPREMRPPIRPGSALLQVDPDCTKSGVKIYVDAHNLAYNAVCNQFDIQTGVNKFWKIQLLQVLLVALVLVVAVVVVVVVVVVVEWW